MAPVAVSYNPKRLFAKASLVDTLKEQFSKVVTQVGEIPKEQFLSSSDEQIFEYVFSKLEVNPIVLHENKMHQGEPEETLVSAVPRPTQGFRIVVTIPYSGDHRLWDLGPSQFLSTLPTGEPQPAVRNNPVGYLNITLHG